MNEQVKEIKARYEAPSKGPWLVGHGLFGYFVLPANDPDEPIATTGNNKDNAEFIAQSRQDINTLLEILEATQAERDWLAAENEILLNLKEELSVITQKLDNAWKRINMDRLFSEFI